MLGHSPPQLGDEEVLSLQLCGQAIRPLLLLGERRSGGLELCPEGLEPLLGGLAGGELFVEPLPCLQELLRTLLGGAAGLLEVLLQQAALRERLTLRGVGAGSLLQRRGPSRGQVGLQLLEAHAQHDPILPGLVSLGASLGQGGLQLGDARLLLLRALASGDEQLGLLRRERSLGVALRLEGGDGGGEGGARLGQLEGLQLRELELLSPLDELVLRLREALLELGLGLSAAVEREGLLLQQGVPLGELGAQGRAGLLQRRLLCGERGLLCLELLDRLLQPLALGHQQRLLCGGLVAGVLQQPDLLLEFLAVGLQRGGGLRLLRELGLAAGELAAQGLALALGGDDALLQLADVLLEHLFSEGGLLLALEGLLLSLLACLELLRGGLQPLVEIER